jgi:hypothetical protein
MVEVSLAAVRRDAGHVAPQSAAPQKGAVRTEPAPPGSTAVLAHPAVAHPTNAVVRATAVRQLQRGIGNHAVQAAVAMLAAADRRRDVRAREQQTREDEPLQPAQEEATEQRVLPPEPPLNAEPIRLEYDVADRFDPGPAAPATARNVSRAAEVQASGQAAYAALHHHGLSLHRATLDDANRALAGVVEAHAEALAWLDSHEQNSRQQTDSAETFALRAVEQSADVTILRVKAAHDAAVKTLADIVRQANGHVGGLDKHAQDEGNKVVGGAKQLYSDAFETAGKECDQQEDGAEKGLKVWLQKIDTVYPAKGDALHIAYAEARRNAAPSAVQNDIAGLQAMKKSVHESFEQVKPQLTSQVGKALDEAIKKNIKAGIDKGYATIATARKQALQGLEQQLHDGLQAIEQMRRGGRAGIRSEAQAARSRLANTVRARKAALRADADRSMQSVTTGVQPPLRLYAASPERFASMLRNAAHRGPEGLAQTGRTAPPGIHSSMDNARRRHAERVIIDVASMRGMLNRDEQQCATETEEEMTRSRQAFDHVLDEVTPEFDASAASQQTAFTAIAENVRTTADAWANSYAGAIVTSMAAFRKAAHESFNMFMTGVLPKGAKAQPGEKSVPFDETKKGIADEFAKRKTDSIAALFEPMWVKQDELLGNNLRDKTDRFLAAIENGNGGGATAPLRSLTAAQGDAIDQIARGRGVYLGDYLMLQTALGHLDEDDYHAIIAYLRGDHAQGARFEIKASLGFWSDDKARIEEAMRNLTSDELEKLHTEGSDAIEAARGWWHLRGTDLEVFDALSAGQPAKADAIRAIQKVDEAKRSGDYDKLNAALTAAFSATNYGQKEITADEHRKDVLREMATILRGRSPALMAAGPPIDDQTVVKNFVSEQVEVPVGDEMGTTIALQIEGANKKLAFALIEEDPNSLAVKTAQLGVEAQRPDGPTVRNVDKALVDERLKPISALTEDGKQKTKEMLAKDEGERKKAQEEHDTLIVNFARQYCNAPGEVSVEEAKRLARQKFGDRLGHDTKGGTEYVGALVDLGYPTPEMAARGMSYAMYSSFWHTDKDLMRQIVSRMDADEIQKMRVAFQDFTGKDLYAELGVYGHGGWFTTLSGDSRLEFERLLLGRPRNDFERAQLALFTIEQQKRETGAVGKFLAGGSYAERAMEQTESELIASLGAKATVDSEGRLKVPAGVFDQSNRYNDKFAGANREKFDVSVALAKTVAENYAARIDAIASSVTTLIAIIGTVVAAVVTVATGGLASPLLLGAIALTAGLAGMGAHRLISGGRYGWHEAARDFGMTLVQAITAGVGAQLAIVSRGGMAAIEAAQLAEEAALAGTATAEQLALRESAQMGQILGSKAADVALIGATTGAIGGAGQALFNEKTWEKGVGDAFTTMLEGTIRGALAGLATSVASQAIEGIPLGRLAGAKGGTIGELMSELGKAGKGNLFTASIGRGVLKSLSSSFGAMAGKSVEVGWDKAAGRFQGNAAEEIVHAGAFAALQGGLEGMAEAPTERWRSNRQAARVQALREQGEATRGVEQTKPPTVPLPSEGFGEPPRIRPIEEPPKPRVQSAAVPEAPAELPARVPRAPEEPAPRLGPPRATGQPPVEASQPILRQRGDLTLLPEETVIQGPNPTSVEEANRIYGNTIADQPDREAAIYRNPETGEFIVIQGEAGTVGVRATPGAELEEPKPGGSAQRWKEILEGPDTGRWELVAHFHPADQPGGGMSLPGRLPSGAPGDFQVMEGEAAIAGTARQSRIHYFEKGKWGHTDFGYDLLAPKARYWVDHADPVSGGRTRVEFESLEQYRDWFKSNFGRAPDMASAPSRTPATPTMSPEAAVSLDRMLKIGVPIEYPSPDVVAKARFAFQTGTATPGDIDTLIKKAVADVRTMLATRAITASDDLKQLSWHNVKGECGPGRDYVAASLGTLLMDADRPVVFQRFQAKEIFGVGKHGFTVVVVKDEPGWAFILDPTFAQFMRPSGNKTLMAEATANVLREHPTGAFMAHDLVRDGYIPLTKENAALYARAMGVPEDQAEAIGARLFHGDATELTEQVGGPDRRPPVTHITNADTDTASVQEMHGWVSQRIDEITGRGGGHQTEHAQLADFQARLGEALARGPIAPEAEGGPPVTARRGGPGAPRAPTSDVTTGGPVPEPIEVGAPPMAPMPRMRASVSEAVGQGFRGDIAREGRLSFSAIDRAADTLTAAGAPFAGRLERIGEDYPPLFTLRSRNGEVRVRIENSDAMPQHPSGVPVAAVTPQPDGNLYILRVSSRADKQRDVTRAIAGQLTEIAAGHGAPEIAEALGAGGRGGRLSPADEGKMAEFAILARALETEQAPEKRNAIRLEAEELVHAMGLTGPSAIARKRGQAALQVQDMTESARALLKQATEDAATNPFLLSLTSEAAQDRTILDGALKRIAALGSEKDAKAWREQLVKVLAHALIDERVVARAAGAPVANGPQMAALMGLDLPTAMGALAARKDPLHALFADASRAAREGLAKGTMAPSESRRPAPGFEAEVTSAATAKLVQASPSGEFRRGALAIDPAARPAGERVEELLARRNDEIRDQGVLEAELDKPGTPEARREQIRQRLVESDTIVTKATEDLGTEAGRAYARLHLDGFREVPMPRGGAGVPDLVFEHPDGRIVVIECKGGDARLGTRLDASGRILVQQGTIEYLKSLAATMAASEPGPIRDLGERLQVALASEQPNIEYHVVRQPLNEDGSLASPQYGKFDLKANERRP